MIKQFTIISLLDIFHNYYATRLLLNGFITLEYIKRIFQNYLNDFHLRQSSHSVCFPRKNCSRFQEDICGGVHKVRDQLISFVDSFSRICSDFKSYFTINYTLTIWTVLFQNFSRWMLLTEYYIVRVSSKSAMKIAFCNEMNHLS